MLLTHNGHHKSGSEQICSGADFLTSYPGHEVRNDQTTPTQDQTMQTSNNMNMNFIVWNCTGAPSPDFRRNFRSLLDYHRPTLVALLENHLADHQDLRADFQFSDMAQVPAVGHSGGLVLLWHREALTVDILAITQ